MREAAALAIPARCPIYEAGARRRAAPVSTTFI
jgi:hypothetical protein